MSRGWPARDGVHVGQDDLPPGGCAGRCRRGALDRPLHAYRRASSTAGCLEPATYLAIGPVFATADRRSTGSGASASTVSRGPRHARSGAAVPLVAIGGITLATAPAVIDAGADAVAVISDLLWRSGGERELLRRACAGVWRGRLDRVLSRRRVCGQASDRVEWSRDGAGPRTSLATCRSPRSNPPDVETELRGHMWRAHCFEPSRSTA